jgi:hypothetical protein
MASGSSSVVENSPRHPKVEGSSLGTVVGAGREKTEEKRLRYLATPLLKTASTLLISHEYRMSGYNVVVAVILVAVCSPLRGMEGSRFEKKF